MISHWWIYCCHLNCTRWCCESFHCSWAGILGPRWHPDCVCRSAYWIHPACSLDYLHSGSCSLVQILSSYLSVFVGVLGCYLLAISSIVPWGMRNPGCVDDLVPAYDPLFTILFFFWFLVFLLQFLSHSPVLFPLCCCHVWFDEYFLHSLHLSQVLGVLDHQPLRLFVLEPHFHGPRCWSVFWLYSCDLVNADFDVESVYADFLHFLQVMFDSGFVVVRAGLSDTVDNDTFFPRVFVLYLGCRNYSDLGNFFQVRVNRGYLGIYFVLRIARSPSLKHLRSCWWFFLFSVGAGHSLLLFCPWFWSLLTGPGFASHLGWCWLFFHQLSSRFQLMPLQVGHSHRRTSGIFPCPQLRWIPQGWCLHTFCRSTSESTQIQSDHLFRPRHHQSLVHMNCKIPMFYTSQFPAAHCLILITMFYL